MIFFVRFGDFDYSVKGKISAPSADIIPKLEYIRTIGADINKLNHIGLRAKKEVIK